MVDVPAAPASSSRPAEWPVLAGVRFVMALAVANFHLFVVKPDGQVPLLGELGSLGCILGFLVISGYSIAHSISTQPKGFVGRRAWRVMPVYYATMAFALLPYLWERGPSLFRFPIDDFKLSEVLGSVFLLQCFVTDKIPVFGPSWTLAIEWWFYMLAPLFVRVRPRLLVLLVALSAAFVYFRLPVIGYPVHIHRHGVPAILLLWAWLSGFVFYRARGYTAVLVVVAGFWVAGRYPEANTQLPYMMAAFAVVWVKHLPPIPAALARVLNYLGDLSYPLYLVHLPLMLWVSRWTKLTSPYAFLGLSLAASAALYHGLDAPLRQRFSRRRA